MVSQFIQQEERGLGKGSGFQPAVSFTLSEIMMKIWCNIQVIKYLTFYINDIVLFQHQQQVVTAVERAKQVTMSELNSIIGVSLCLWQDLYYMVGHLIIHSIYFIIRNLMAFQQCSPFSLRKRLNKLEINSSCRFSKSLMVFAIFILFLCR